MSKEFSRFGAAGMVAGILHGTGLDAAMLERLRNLSEEDQQRIRKLAEDLSK